MMRAAGRPRTNSWLLIARRLVSSVGTTAREYHDASRPTLARLQRGVISSTTADRERNTPVRSCISRQRRQLPSSPAEWPQDILRCRFVPEPFLASKVGVVRNELAVVAAHAKLGGEAAPAWLVPDATGFIDCGSSQPHNTRGSKTIIRITQHIPHLGTSGQRK